jgi:2-methylisocitrate lyase-like PEP mutase family enzyme
VLSVPSLLPLAELGVQRISVGGALAQVAWAAVLATAEEIRAGSFNGLAAGASGRQLNDLFGSFA